MRLWVQAVRQLLRTPGFVVVATLALVLGIGSTTAIFTVVRAVFLRGLPYADADSLVRLGSSVPDQGITGAGFSYPRFEAVRDRQTVFSALSYAAFTAFTLTASQGDPEQVQGMQTAHDYDSPCRIIETVVGQQKCVEFLDLLVAQRAIRDRPDWDVPHFITNAAPTDHAAS